MNIRAHAFISGNVQGVFFRSKTKSEANKLNVRGWVRNLHDERVEAMFEGEEEDVAKLIEFCKKGPPTAQVSGINVTVESYSGEYSTFKICY